MHLLVDVMPSIRFRGYHPTLLLLRDQECQIHLMITKIDSIQGRIPLLISKSKVVCVTDKLALQCGHTHPVTSRAVSWQRLGMRCVYELQSSSKESRGPAFEGDS